MTPSKCKRTALALFQTTTASCLLLGLAASSASAQPYPEWELPNPNTLIYATGFDWATPAFSCLISQPDIDVQMITDARPPNTRQLQDDVVEVPTTITLTSGRTTVTLPAVATVPAAAGRIADKTIVSATLAPDSPILAAFARTGSIRLESLGASHSPPPAPLDKIAAMLASCRKAP